MATPIFRIRRRHQALSTAKYQPDKRVAFQIQSAKKDVGGQVKRKQKHEVKNMALTRSFKETVVQRVQSDAAFAHALLDEAATLFLNGEPETARLILRDLVNATMGFEPLATFEPRGR